MKFKALSFISLAAGLLLPAAAFAQPVYPNADNAALVSRLQKQEKIDEYKAKYWSQEPLTQQDYYVQVKEDRALIAKISAGEPVSNDDLAEALEASQNRLLTLYTQKNRCEHFGCSHRPHRFVTSYLTSI